MSIKTILLTGATGFLGQALIPFLLKEYKPDSIRLLGRSEWELAKIIRQYDDLYSFKQFRPMIADIRDLPRMVSITKNVDLLIHTAALKRLEMINYCPQEGILTNIIGSMNVLHCVINNDIPKSVWVSSDKAVAPTNLYGATKKVMEEMVIQRSVHAQQKMILTRYGNVCFSKGAALPYFIEKIKNNEDIPLTDERMSRFLVTKRIAIDTIKRAIGCEIQGQVVLPDELCAVNIKRMIEVLIDYYDSRSKIVIIGMFSGEKIAEEIAPGILSDDWQYQVSNEQLIKLLKEDYPL